MDNKGIDIYIGSTSVRTCLGDESETALSMEKGKSGLAYNEAFGMYAGTLSIKGLEGYTRFESLLIEQINNVLHSSSVRLDDSSVQLIISTTKGNVELLDGKTSVIDSRAFLYSSAAAVSRYFNCSNKPVVISNACISGVSAIVYAKELLKSCKVRHAVIVGCDVISGFITKGFASFKSISSQPCRPYDTDRDGLTLGEACGALVLTTDVGTASQPFVYLLGGSITNDANHISGPSRTGDGLFYAIDRTLNESGLSVGDVGFVNAHGTATVYNDEMESKAIEWAGLNSVPLNSLKGYIGHTLGASGVVETIICIDQLRRGYIFGTKGFSSLGTPFRISVSDRCQTFGKKCCVKTASGFGGCNAAILLSMYKPAQTVGGESCSADADVVAEYSLPQSSQSFADFIRCEYKGKCEPNMKFYKMSDMSKALYVAVENLVSGNVDFAGCDPLRKAIILSNSSSSLDSDINHQIIIDRNLPEGASPAVFVYTLPNVSAGEICIRHKIKGDNTFFIEERQTELAEDYARRLIETDRADFAICGWCDYLNGIWNVNLKLLKRK